MSHDMLLEEHTQEIEGYRTSIGKRGSSMKADKGDNRNTDSNVNLIDPDKEKKPKLFQKKTPKVEEVPILAQPTSNTIGTLPSNNGLFTQP